MISGPYGAGNYGDDVLGRIICDQLSARGASVLVAADNPGDAAEYFGDKYELRPRLNLRGRKFNFFKDIRRLDMFVVGGGEQMYEPRFPNPIYGHLATNLQATLAATKMGKRAACLAVGVDDRLSRLGKLTASAILSKATFLGVRDVASGNRLRALVRKSTEVHVGADPAFLLAQSQPLSCASDSKAGNRSVLITPSVDKRHSMAFIPALNKLTYELTASGYSVIYACSDLQPSYDRVLFDEKLLDLPAGASWLSPDESTIETYLNLVKSVDCVVSSRMHPLIFALALNKPIVCISRAAKMEALMESLNLDFQSIETLVTERLISSVWRCLEQDQSITSPAEVQLMIERASTQFDAFARAMSA